MQYPLTSRKIFYFWLPLAATWLMMAFEGPYISALIARLADAKFNLAAFGVAFSFALLSEAPVIMMMAAATALVKNSQTYKKLRNFNIWIIGLVTGFLALSLIPSFFFFITIDIMNLDARVAYLTHSSLFFLIPWPGAISYRRFLQGIMIANNKTRLVSYGTVIRVISVAISAYLLYTFTDAPGAWVGAASLSSGVLLEMFASHFMCRAIVRSLKNRETEEDINYGEIFKFYYPLVMAAFLGFGIHPLLAFFLAQGKMAIESLAVLPVVNALIFIFRAVGLSFQEVVIALIGYKNEGYQALKKFAIYMAALNILILAIVAYTPLSYIWFNSVSGLSTLLTDLAIVPTRILVFIAALTVLISFQRAVQVVKKDTKHITVATFIEVFGITLILYTGIFYLDMVGINAAAVALITGRIAANIYLGFTNRRLLNPS